MQESNNSKKYDLEERTLKFAQRIRLFIKQVPYTLINTDDLKQLLRSSGSIGANYIEANESLGRKDFMMRIKISRKEAKESRYWLNLITSSDPLFLKEKNDLINESTELTKIFGAIVRKLEG